MNTKTDLVIATIAFSLIGGILSIIGLVMAISGDPSLLHPYHLNNVAPELYPELAKECGAAAISVGIGTSLFGWSLTALGGLRSHRAARVALCSAGLILLVGGIAFALYAIVSHGGSLW